MIVEQKNKLDKEKLKKIIMNSLADFTDIQINLDSQNAREVIAVRIASDVLNSLQVKPVSPEDIFQK
tara:strand:- start:559 stop:759 length:201 start_codon:yes stop_codon:yes gene_type:complete